MADTVAEVGIRPARAPAYLIMPGSRVRVPPLLWMMKCVTLNECTNHKARYIKDLAGFILSGHCSEESPSTSTPIFIAAVLYG